MSRQSRKRGIDRAARRARGKIRTQNREAWLNANGFFSGLAEYLRAHPDSPEAQMLKNPEGFERSIGLPPRYGAWPWNPDVHGRVKS